MVLPLFGAFGALSKGKTGKRIGKNIGLTTGDVPQLSTNIDAINLGQTRKDEQYLRDRRDKGIDGLSQSGVFSQAAARDAFKQGSDDAQKALASNTASQTANAELTGLGASGGERIATAGVEAGARQQQNIAGQGAAAQNQIAVGDVSRQEDFRDKAAFFLPTSSRATESTQFQGNLAKGQFDIGKERTNIALEEQAESARRRKLGAFANAIGGKAGGAVAGIFG